MLFQFGVDVGAEGDLVHGEGNERGGEIAIRGGEAFVDVDGGELLAHAVGVIGEAFAESGEVRAFGFPEGLFEFVFAGVLQNEEAAVRKHSGLLAGVGADLAGGIVHPVGVELDVEIGEAVFTHELLQVISDGLQGELRVASAVSVEDDDPAAFEAELEGLHEGLEADVFLDVSLFVEDDVGIAANQDAGSGGEIGKRVEGGDGRQASFHGGEIGG